MRCLKCFRPIQNCYCKNITPIDTGIKFVFLMHPHEAKKHRTGAYTGSFWTPNPEIKGHF
ncbi:MAG: DTW domain-containing protein [Spirochaetales bacterium]|nr:DTW domain-containing protein [Spirochaetales bacterium]